MPFDTGIRLVERCTLETLSVLTRLTGGAVYDALIAATAAEHGVELPSCDRRAASTDERYGMSFALL